MNTIDTRLTKNAIIQFIGKFCTTGLGFLSIALLTRELGPEQFGWYVSAVTLLQFVAIMADFGMIPLSAHFFSTSQNEEKTWGYLFGFRTATACALLLPAPLLSYAFPYPDAVHTAAWMLSLSFIAIAIAQICIGFLQHKLLMGEHALADTLGRAATVIGILIGMRLNWPFLALVGVLTSGTILTTSYLLFAVSRHVRIIPKYNKQEWKNIIKTMWPIAVAILFNVVYLKGDTLLLSWYADQKAVGLYGGAYRVIDIITQTAMMLMGMMLPLFAASWAKKQENDFAAYHKKAWLLMSVFILPATIGGIILAEPIMVLVGGAAFAPASHMLRTLLLAVCGVSLSAIYGHMAVATSRQKQTLPIYMGSASITLIGYLLFIPKYGANGAAWMTVLSECLTGIGLMIALKYYTKSKLPLKQTALVAISAIIMGLSLLPIQHLPLIFTVPFGASIYTAMLIIFGIFPKETLLAFIKYPSGSGPITETHEL